MSWFRWRPYVSVAERRYNARRKMEKLRKKGMKIMPLENVGRNIARTFWGKAWCEHLESFSDYENRLPRGRTYVRNGLVCHLDIQQGRLSAMVSGFELYNVNIEIKKLPRKKWREVKSRCSGKIGSLLELLQGRLSKSVMTVVTDRVNGLFPLPREISLNCSCPDWAVMCKHVAAVLYGVGARLDEQPELLFHLRGVDHEELITAGAAAAGTIGAGAPGKRRRLKGAALGDVFGIDLDTTPEPKKPKRKKSASAKTTAKKQLTTENPKTAKKKVASKTARKKPKAAKKKTTAGTTAKKRATAAKSKPGKKKSVSKVAGKKSKVAGKKKTLSGKPARRTAAKKKSTRKTASAGKRSTTVRGKSNRAGALRKKK